jgi:hypothetical protein
MAELAEDIQILIEDKKQNPDECEFLACKSKRKFIVTVRYGVRDQDKDTFIVCADCRDALQKDAKAWAYGFFAELVPGESEPVRIKKRGRPKN